MMAATPPPGACPSGVALSSFDLEVLTDDETPVNLRSVTRLDGGFRVRYKPKGLFGADLKPDDAEVALISIPTTPTGVLAIMEAKKASEVAEWLIPSRASAVALVYGPRGLKLGKVADLVQRDPELISQLALYAEKSAQTEMLMETVSTWERSRSGQTLEAALAGFSSRSGVAVPMLNRDASTDQQALTLMRALNPALSGFDPLAPTPGARLQQSGSLAAAVAGVFFGSPVGLATMGGAMFLNMRSMMFPGSEFRAALAQPMVDAQVLCARREPVKSRTRPVYMWAWRIQGPPAPRLQGLPYRANLGPPVIRIPLQGTNLENIRGVSTSLEGATVSFVAEPPSIELKPPAGAKKGERIDLRFEVEDSPAPLVLANAIELLDARPVLERAQATLANDLPLALKAGELPAAGFTAVALRTVGAGAMPAVHVECGDPVMTLKKLTLRPGEQTAGARLRTVSPGELFLSFEPGAVGQPPCELMARVETGDGLSEPLALGRMVRVPRIDKFTLTGELMGERVYAGWLEGEELESIEKTGWNEADGVPVSGAPVPVANSSSRQRLKISMPWPPPAPRAPVYVWLRGEEAGRRSTAVY